MDLDGNRDLDVHDAPVIGQVRCSKLAGAEAKWDSCKWVKVEQQGINSHQPLPSWCPEGSFITAMDLDGNRDLSGSDAPVIGQVRCCKLSGFNHWGSSTGNSSKGKESIVINQAKVGVKTGHLSHK
jgi:hypothetical protein